MKVTKVNSVEDYKIVSSFQTLRKTLLDDRYADRLEKPLAYWALPNDRRLPLAFLGRTIKDLLATPFEELSATPGIGQKKISSLVKLLSRATKDHPPAVPFGLNDLSDGQRKIAEMPVVHTGFDPALVSEVLWSEWQRTVVEHNLGSEKLGHIAPTLQSLPTLIWHTPLSTYVTHTVAEIRQFKTHGEKRVRAVLEVFYLVHEMLGDKPPIDHLALRIVPKFILPIEGWISQSLEQAHFPTPEAIRQNLTVPLVDQVEIDAGTAIRDLAATRLGIDGPAQSVREQSRRMGVTRARVYQLLEDCSRVMAVRWPEGEAQLARVSAKAHAEGVPVDDLRLLAATRELFFSNKPMTIEEEHSGVPEE